MYRRVAFIVFTIACCVFGSASHAKQDAPPAEPQVPWPVQLGARSLQIETAFPAISRVVIVPDARTYLDELNKWSPAGHWPVLFEDDHLAPMFIRRYRPREVIRRSAVEDDSSDQRILMTDAVVHAWGGDPERHSIDGLFAIRQYRPPGVVIASADDPAWTAAVALAAGRGQPLLWLDGEFGRPDDILDHDIAMRLIESIDDLVDQTGYPHDGLGDGIDTITLCRSVGGSARIDPEVVVTDPRLPPQYADGPRAITDLIGRTKFKDRYAYTGWIFGDEARSAYMAMCSLFLPRDRVQLIHTYPNNDQWNQYHTSAAAASLDRRGYAVENRAGQQTGTPAWRRMLTGGLDTDIVMMNTKGGSDYFDLFDKRAAPHDVPLLDSPVAVHLIHSWALRYPARLDSVGGQWLDRGAYALVGSVHEPYLTAFQRPAALAERITNYVPLLIAARWWDGEGPMADAWRVNTIGDPLMTCPPPGGEAEDDVLVLRDQDGNRMRRRRVDVAADYGTNLLTTMPERMRAAASDTTGEALAGAIGDLILIGRDDLAVQMWTMSQGRGVSDEMLTAAAGRVLPALFRSGDSAAFVQAFDLAEDPDERDITMLWHLIGPSIGAGIDVEMVRLLAAHPRRPLVHIDLERIAPDIVRHIGRDYLRQRLLDERAAATETKDQEGLERLLMQYKE